MAPSIAALRCCPQRLQPQKMIHWQWDWPRKWKCQRWHYDCLCQSHLTRDHATTHSGTPIGMTRKGGSGFWLVTSSFDLPKKLRLRSQTNRAAVCVPFLVCHNDITRIVAATSPKVKASWHNVSLNNIFYSHISLRSISFDNKLHYPFLLVHTTTILQSVFSYYHGLFCPIKAQDTRVIMDWQYHDKKNAHYMESLISASPTLSSSSQQAWSNNNFWLYTFICICHKNTILGAASTYNNYVIPL